MENKQMRAMLEEYDHISQQKADVAVQMMQAIMLEDRNVQTQIAVRLQLRQIIERAVNLKQYRRAEKLLFVLQQLEDQNSVSEKQLSKKLGQKMCTG